MARVRINAAIGLDAETDAINTRKASQHDYAAFPW